MLDRTIERTWKALSCILEIRIIGLASIRAPMTFVGPGLSIEHDDSMIHVSIGDVEFVRLFIDDQRSRTAEVLRVIASASCSCAFCGSDSDFPHGFWFAPRLFAESY